MLRDSAGEGHVVGQFLAGLGTCPSPWGFFFRDHTGCRSCHCSSTMESRDGHVGANSDGSCLIELLLGFELMNHNCKKS